jgi:hypothetical protein
MNDVEVLAYYITFLWVFSMLLIQYWIGKLKEEKEAK